MNRKTLVPPPISAAIGTFGLPREVLVELVDRLHADLPSYYERKRGLREADDRLYRHSITIQTDKGKHHFALTVDDTSSPEHLAIMAIHHSFKPT